MDETDVLAYRWGGWVEAVLSSSSDGLAVLLEHDYYKTAIKPLEERKSIDDVRKVIESVPASTRNALNSPCFDALCYGLCLVDKHGEKVCEPRPELSHICQQSSIQAVRFYVGLLPVEESQRVVDEAATEMAYRDLKSTGLQCLLEALKDSCFGYFAHRAALYSAVSHKSPCLVYLLKDWQKCDPSVNELILRAWKNPFLPSFQALFDAGMPVCDKAFFPTEEFAWTRLPTQEKEALMMFFLVKSPDWVEILIVSYLARILRELETR